MKAGTALVRVTLSLMAVFAITSSSQQASTDHARLLRSWQTPEAFTLEHAEAGTLACGEARRTRGGFEVRCSYLRDTEAATLLVSTDKDVGSLHLIAGTDELAVGIRRAHTTSERKLELYEVGLSLNGVAETAYLVVIHGSFEQRGAATARMEPREEVEAFAARLRASPFGARWVVPLRNLLAHGSSGRSIDAFLTHALSVAADPGGVEAGEVWIRDTDCFPIEGGRWLCYDCTYADLCPLPSGCCGAPYYSDTDKSGSTGGDFP